MHSPATVNSNQGVNNTPLRAKAPTHITRLKSARFLDTSSLRHLSKKVVVGPGRPVEVPQHQFQGHGTDIMSGHTAVDERLVPDGFDRLFQGLRAAFGKFASIWKRFASNILEQDIGEQNDANLIVSFCKILAFRFCFKSRCNIKKRHFRHDSIWQRYNFHKIRNIISAYTDTKKLKFKI